MVLVARFQWIPVSLLRSKGDARHVQHLLLDFLADATNDEVVQAFLGHPQTNRKKDSAEKKEMVTILPSPCTVQGVGHSNGNRKITLWQSSKIWRTSIGPGAQFFVTPRLAALMAWLVSTCRLVALRRTGYGSVCVNPNVNSNISREVCHIIPTNNHQPDVHLLLAKKSSGCP